MATDTKGKVYECVFNNVNGENTGVYTRLKMSANSTSPGILYKKNCPDESKFYCDPNVGGTNNYYKLINPERYKGLTFNKGATVYVWLDNSFLKSWKLVDAAKATNYGKSATTTNTTTQNNTNSTNSRPTTNTTQNTTTNTTTPSSTQNTGSKVIPGLSSKTVSTEATSNVNNINDYNGTGIGESFGRYNINKPYGALTPKGGWNDNVPDNYFMDYNNFKTDLSIVENNLNIFHDNTIKDYMLTRFNRFKIAFPNSALSKTFAHVFFTRPDLNLYGSNNELLPNVANNSYFYYLHKNSPDLLKSLTISNFSTGILGKHDFNPFLSNKAGSFELKDEYVDTDEYGETYTGWKIKYGKNNIKSKTADNFSIMYTDDNNYNIYKIHKAWTDYISKVYRGEFAPKRSYITDNVIDYACSVYYFICGPDGETLLFWSKYTGVFPTNAPSSASSWQKGNILKMPEFSINYEYSWKEDMSPTTLAEFNKNSAQQTKYTYLKTYEQELVSTGKTFSGAPFIESVGSKIGTYNYKLRFRA